MTFTEASLLKKLEAKAAKASPVTANRYMSLIRAVLRRACDVWEWTEQAPKVPMYSVNSKSTRWITREHAQGQLARFAEHQADMMQLALATGLRQRNVCRLEWQEADWERCLAVIPAGKCKMRRG